MPVSRYHCECGRTDVCMKYIALLTQVQPTPTLQGQFIYVKFVFEALSAAADSASSSSPPPWTLEALQERLPSGSGVTSVYFHILQVCCTICWCGQPHRSPHNFVTMI